MNKLLPQPYIILALLAAQLLPHLPLWKIPLAAKHLVHCIPL